MQYTHILFDADETLFSFNAYLGLKTMLLNYGVEFSEQDYQGYKDDNAALWVQYQNGEINAETLQVTRFTKLAAELNVKPQELNDAFLDAMAEICQPLLGAKALLESLHGKVKLGIITNGFTKLQQKRLAHTGFADYFEALIISEQIGKAKPAPEPFAAALAKLGNPDKSKVLMVGDTLESDVLGANRFGIDSCWLQHAGVEGKEGIKPTYTVSSLYELAELLADKIAA
ncbi:pyrimidine 5'-nucleotidase [Pseudoalteromonas sp. SS15]|uniref:pyrimidine 5'-nucleotidase n=1 Tax=Pseudoalteromonas sp. SS15 TaxID=3139393 RepID=UPI003BAD49D1